MMPVSRFLIPPVLLLCTLVGTVVAQTTGRIEGSIRDSLTGEPVIGAKIVAQTVEPPHRTIGKHSGRDGAFRLPSVAPGRYLVTISSVGYSPSDTIEVVVRTGELSKLDAILSAQDIMLNDVNVTGSRKLEKVLDAPASVWVADPRVVEQTIALTPFDHLKGVAGVDIAQKGLIQNEIVARGFSNVFSGSLMVLTDGRLSGVPSLRANLSYLIPIVNEDIEHLELVRGPGSALYGPNASSGVLNIITKSPFSSPGTSLQITGGTQELAHGELRHAGTVGDQFGYKISAQYMRGKDWMTTDTAEAALRRELIDGGSLADTLLVGHRDPIIERYGAEARVDYLISEGVSAQGAFGLNEAVRNTEMTDLGAVQGRNWRYTYGRARFDYDRLSVQGFINMSDAGETYLLRSGQRIIDRSMQIVGRAQHGTSIGESEELTYGGDVQLTRPETEGTIMGRNEDDDDITELGAYLQSETYILDKRITLVAAGRIDINNRINDPVFSPRAAFVYKPTVDQQVRLTYNEAFTTPSTNDLFLDILSERNLFGFPDEFGTDLWLAGVPKDGWHFKSDASGFFFHSPMAPSAAAEIPVAGASALWPAATQFVLAGIQGDTSIPAEMKGPLAQFLQSLEPGAADIAGRMALLNPSTGAFDPVSTAADIEALRPTKNRTIEIGYKGIIAEKLQLGADVYWTHMRDFIGPMLIFTPNVFLDAQQTAAYLQPRMAAAMKAYLMSQGMPEAMAEEQGRTIAAQYAPELAAGYGRIPLGTVTPEGASDPTGILVSSRNYGEVDLTGIDLSANYRISSEWSVALGGSWSGRTFLGLFDFDNEGEAPPFNAPELRGFASVGYRNDQLGVHAESRLRHADAFVMRSGVYEGFVPSYNLVDLSVGYRLPGMRSIDLTLSATNILDHRHFEFVGGGEVGTALSLRAGIAF